METWDQMTKRHKQERKHLLSQNDRAERILKKCHAMERRDQVSEIAMTRKTQTEAAKILGVRLTCLNNFIQRNDIFWPVKRQGRTKQETAA